MKVAEFRTKDIKDLHKVILDCKRELFNLRFQKAQGQLTNTARVREVRRTIARSYTILKEREVSKS